MSQSVSSPSVDRGLLLVRLALGLVFVMHGWMKLTVFGVAGTAGFMASLGIPLPTVNAVIIIAVELVGGLMLAAGAGTRVVGALLSFSMLVAVITAHAANGFFLPNGYEFALTMALVSLAVVLTGAGQYSVDARLFGRTAVLAPEMSHRKAA
jgi:putative oxidoreductase